LPLNQGPDKTLFVLRDETIEVEGPDGKPMTVSARTALGHAGPIEFHRDSIKTLPPAQVLFLMMHEFEHKAIVNGASVSDNEPVGPFTIGRDLLDAVATTMVASARRNGKVGGQFGIRDIFDCSVTAGGAQIGARVSSSRLFQAEDLMSYEISIGRNQTDGSVYVPETDQSSLRLRVLIKEPNNCGDPTPARGTILQIVRETRGEDGSVNEAVLTSETNPTNPICPKTHTPLEIAWQNVRFKCSYFGSEGTTASMVSFQK
jgi:hypothetical protein